MPALALVAIPAQGASLPPKSSAPAIDSREGRWCVFRPWGYPTSTPFGRIHGVYNE